MHTHSSHPEQYVERVREFSKHLGNPLRRGVRFIHVAGTAGKGTTTAYLHNILHKAGNRVGSFTSPYATTSIEKIKVNNKLIDPNVFVELVEQLKPVINKMEKEYAYGRPSYFEIFFMVALLYFKKMKCNWVVLEVGCGGRFDPGIIFPNAISAITNIGLDHTQLLGKTLPKIAKEKAGIIRENSHLFTTEKRLSILKIFKKICKEKNTKIHIIKEGMYASKRCAGDAHFVARMMERSDPSERRNAHPRTPANASLASMVAKHLKISDRIIQDAITDTSLPCRFEIIQKNPLIILDGAHNPDKIKNVVHNLKHLTYGRLYTMFASGTLKDARSMVRQLARVSDIMMVTTVQGKGKTFYSPKELARFVPQGVKKTTVANPQAALAAILKKIKPDDCLLITGSFYLAGELRKRWMSEETVLTNRNHA
ncbi:hypothetical protein BK004_00970 [bacterium CG10_46_32]|nr:MAG: hypothetical protein BK004_00970 [bacterium CG10_46_32]